MGRVSGKTMCTTSIIEKRYNLVSSDSNRSLSFPPYFSIFCGTLSIVVRARRKTPGECSGASNNVRYANLINFNWPFQGEGREAGKF